MGMVSVAWMVFIDGRAALTFSKERLLSSLPQLTCSSPSDRDIHRKVLRDFSCFLVFFHHNSSSMLDAHEA